MRLLTHLLVRVNTAFSVQVLLYFLVFRYLNLKCVFLIHFDPGFVPESLVPFCQTVCNYSLHIN